MTRAQTLQDPCMDAHPSNLISVDRPLLASGSEKGVSTGGVGSLRLRTVAPVMAGGQKPPRHRAGERFLKGPIPWTWVTAAGRTPGRGLQVALILWLQVSLTGKRTVTLPASAIKEMNMDRFAVNRGLAALERAGLVSVVRARGVKPRITLLDASTTEPLPVRWNG